MRRAQWLIFLLTLVPWFAAHAGALVFAAASLTDVLDEIVALYQQHTGKSIRVSYGASSTLAKQIAGGAPASIYISADLDWMKYVEKGGFIEGKPYVLAHNRLALIASADSPVTLTIGKGMNLAALLGRERLATGDPASVPVGKYARAALEHYGEWTEMEHRIIPLENVRVALAVVEAGEAPLGIVYATDARGRGVRIVDVFPQESHPPIVYLVGLVKENASVEAGDFHAYLRDDTAIGVLTRHGFLVVP